MQKFKSLELCAGAGGQALGLEQAGFEPLALIEIDHQACLTLTTNKPEWNVIQGDIREFNATGYAGQVDLLAGGVPCPPFSVAGKQLGRLDDRDLFPEALRIAEECKPTAILLENVRGVLEPKFSEYRHQILDTLVAQGYQVDWKLIHASDFGVSQLRPRAILIALKQAYFPYFKWPEKSTIQPRSVGDLLYEEMAQLGWHRVGDWKAQASTIAPTLVGGSKKHGGPDLGPTRARKAWAALGIDGGGLADYPPSPDFNGNPRLTLQMTAMIQGFPVSWKFAGKKTPAYRQVGNAFPPPVARAIGAAIIQALQHPES
jgi:DNA (cytosine-5)-methyltransferase 1